MKISGLEVSHETQVAKEKTSQNPLTQLKYQIPHYIFLMTDHEHRFRHTLALTQSLRDS